MNYEKGYLAMFKALTELTQLCEKIDPSKEHMEIAHFLRAIQVKGEEACITAEQ